MAKRAKNAGSERPSNTAKVVRTPDEMRNGPPAWAAALLMGFLIAAVYGPAITSVPFVFDDRSTILGNDSILSLWPLVGISKPGPMNPAPGLPTSGRPLVNLSFAVNYYFGGTNPAGYHAVNIAIHFMCAMLVWAIVGRTLMLPYFGGRFDRTGGWLAFIVALLWALHPLQTEAVIYVTQRTELSMALFYLATMYCCMRYWTADSKRAAQWFGLAVTACLAGMACKEVMASAPLIVLLFDRTFISGSLGDALRRSWRLYAALAATWILLLALNINRPHSDATGFDLGVSGPAWWLTQSKIFFFYLKLVVWPWPLLFHYAMPYFHTLSEAWMYVLPLGSLGVATLWLLWRNRPVGFLGTWYFALLSPTFVIPIITEMAAERRMYLPLVVPVILFVLGGYYLAVAIVRRRGDGDATLADRKSLSGVAVPAAILAVMFCLVSSLRLGAYDSEMNLWAEVLTAQPENSMAHHALGYYYAHAGDDETAIKEYKEAIRLDPTAVHVHHLLAILLQKNGRYDEAVDHLAECVRLMPDTAVLRNDLGVGLYLAGRNDDAIAEFHKVLEMDPNYWTAYRNMATSYWKVGKKQDSIDAYQAAVRINPEAVDVYVDLAKAYEGNGEPEKSKEALRRGVEVAQSLGEIEKAGHIAQLLDAKH